MGKKRFLICALPRPLLTAFLLGLGVLGFLLSGGVLAPAVAVSGGEPGSWAQIWAEISTFARLGP